MHLAAKLGHQLIMRWACQCGEDWAAPRAPQRPCWRVLAWPTILLQAGVRAESLGVPGMYLLVLFSLNPTPLGTGALTGMLLLTPCGACVG